MKIEFVAANGLRYQCEHAERHASSIGSQGFVQIPCQSCVVKPLTQDQKDGGARWEARQNHGIDY